MSCLSDYSWQKRGAESAADVSVWDQRRGEQDIEVMVGQRTWGDFQMFVAVVTTEEKIWERVADAHLPYVCRGNDCIPLDSCSWFKVSLGGRVSIDQSLHFQLLFPFGAPADLWFPVKTGFFENMNSQCTCFRYIDLKQRWGSWLSL